MKDEDIRAFQQRLTARQLELVELSRISQSQRDAVELDQSSVGRVSRIDAIQNQEMALANARTRQAEHQRIAAALKRIEAGDYGYCIACGEDIAMRRLQSDPSLPTCIACAG